MEKKSLLKNPIYSIGIYSIISFILIFLFFNIVNLEKKVEDEMFKISTSDIISIAQNNANAIQELLKNSHDYVSDIKKSEALQFNIEEKLQTLITNNIKYSYLIYKDKKGVFRFLVDGSNPSEKAFLNQKFDADSSQWLEIYNKKEPVIIKHTILQKLSISYLVPIIHKNEVQLILAIDFSINKVEHINKIIALMKNAIITIMSIIFIFLIVLIVQTIKYSKIKKTAFIDTLTNVYNRNYLQELQETINLENYILATLDIDFFKKVNDTYGHDIGDIILKDVAKIISNTLRGNDDIVIRYGGEEFVLFIKNDNKNYENSTKVLERIRLNIQENNFFISKNDYINITVSIGVNLTPFESKNFADAFKLTDLALYKAKDSGRNNIQIYKD
ncbi:MAG: GGDEF domain-containing protein [Poseidonibacter sp.]|uniref:GGDEF domain-containing protein n=1 Tax=Poseidonibacter sp. TaxID=2321188 RepID=UPI00359CCB68